MITTLIDRIAKNQEEHADLMRQLKEAMAKEPATAPAAKPQTNGHKARTVSYPKIPEAIAAKVLPMLKGGKTIRGVATELGISPTAVARIKKKGK